MDRIDSFPVITEYKEEPMGSVRPLTGDEALQYLKAYFNNKMAVVMMLLQKAYPVRNTQTGQKVAGFFDDLYRYMLRPELQKQYARVFQWLILFFKRFPEVKPRQRDRAVDYVRRIYGLFGMEFKVNQSSLLSG